MLETLFMIANRNCRFMKKQAMDETHSLPNQRLRNQLLAANQTIECYNLDGVAKLLGNLLGILLDGKGGILDELLLVENRTLVELLETTDCHLLLNRLGLTGFGSLSDVNLLLVSNDVSRDILANSADRSGGCNLQRNIVSEGLESVGRSGLGLVESELDENADLATHMDVRRKRTGLNRASGETSDLHVLAHDVNHLGKLIGNGVAVHGLGQKVLDVCGSRLGNNLSDILGETGELGIGADEVGLTGELEKSTGLSVLGDVSGDSALVGLATGLLGCLGKTVLAKNVDSEIDIAVRLDESLLALHHRGVGHLAKLLNHSCGNLGHVSSFRRKDAVRYVYSALGASSAAGASAAISASEICSLPEPARQASAISSHIRVTAEIASSLQGMP